MGTSGGRKGERPENSDQKSKNGETWKTCFYLLHRLWVRMAGGNTNIERDETMKKREF